MIYENDRLSKKIITMGIMKENLSQHLHITILLLGMITPFCIYDYFFMKVHIARRYTCTFGTKIIVQVSSF